MTGFLYNSTLAGLFGLGMYRLILFEGTAAKEDGLSFIISAIVILATALTGKRFAAKASEKASNDWFYVSLLFPLLWGIDAFQAIQYAYPPSFIAIIGCGLATSLLVSVCLWDRPVQTKRKRIVSEAVQD